MTDLAVMSHDRGATIWEITGVCPHDPNVIKIQDARAAREGRPAKAHATNARTLKRPTVGQLKDYQEEESTNE